MTGYYILMWLNLIACVINVAAHNYAAATLSFGVFLMCLKDDK